MKKFILFLLLVSFFSCDNVDLSKPKYQPVTVITNQVSYGTSIEEFLEIAGDRAEKTTEYSYQIRYVVHQYDKDDEIVKTASFYFERERTNTPLNKRKYILDQIRTTK